jgi:CRP/FNR family transcriptional regulator, nitrogen oxide reductase regulator
MPAREAVRLPERPCYPIFQGLPARDLELILSAAATRRISPYTIITAQGEPANQLYILVSGCVRLFYTTEEGRKILLIWVAPGEMFGAATLLATPGTYVLSCESVKESKALVWDRASIRGFAVKYPQIMDNALTAAGDYLKWYASAHVALTCHTARERLAEVLLGLARAIGEKRPNGIEIDVSNEDLANAANITPYTASRLMSEWQKSRAVSKARGKVLLRSAERLLFKTT